MDSLSKAIYRHNGRPGSDSNRHPFGLLRAIGPTRPDIPSAAIQHRETHLKVFEDSFHTAIERG